MCTPFLALHHVSGMTADTMYKYIKKIIPYDDYNGKVPPPEKLDYIGTLTPQFGALALRNGWKIIELFEDDEETETNADKARKQC